MASEQDGQGLKGKVATLVGAKSGSDFHRAFRHYDSNQGGQIAEGELVPRHLYSR